MTELEHWAQAFPHIRWSEPVRVEVTGGDWGYACRICIAQDGLAGSEVHRLTQDAERVREHIENEHA